MFGWFRSKNKEKQVAQPKIVDLNNNPINVGDFVIAQRYDLGKCQLIAEENSYYYQSVENGKKVSWLKMVDAITSFQKVEKVI